MFDGYIIIKNNNKEELILFLNLNYEFGSFKSKKGDIRYSIKKYIRANNIKFNGKKILLATGGILLATLIISNQDIIFSNFDEKNIITYIEESSIKKIIDIKDVKQQIIKENKEDLKQNVSANIIDKKPNKNKNNNVNNKTHVSKNKQNNLKQNNTSIKKNNITSSNKNTSTNKSENIKNEDSTTTEEKVTIYRSNGKILNITLEEYVIGVVAAEMPAAFNSEALKAQAILARTYALKSKSTNKKLTDTVKTQAYIDISQMKDKWKSDFSKYYNKIKDAVNTTKGMYITYNNEIIDAVYHSTSNGYTEDSIEVWGYSIPYLKTVVSTLDKKVKGYETTITKESSIIFKTFGINSLDEIKITKRNSSGRVSEVRVGENTYSGVDIREILSLRSTDFDFGIDGNNLIITTRGYGHGVGMSQYGANEMAKIGKTYNEIIKHYYQGIKIIKK